MAGKLDPRIRRRLAVIEEFLQKVQHVHGLVEQFATARSDPEQYSRVIRRTFTQLKRELTGAGMDAMAQQCAALEIAAGRFGSVRFKARVLREGVASLRSQLEVEQRTLTMVRKDKDQRKPNQPS